MTFDAPFNGTPGTGAMYWPCGAFECETAHTTTNFLHENGTSSPLMARAGECPLSGVKRTWPIAVHMSAFDPKRT